MKRHKVILYNPDAVFYTMPLALVALGSYLDPEQYEVRVVDGRLEKNAVASVVAECDGALCLGITVLTGRPIHDALKISRAVKERHPELPVIWGGWHASLFPTETLEEPSIDVTVQAQGEVTFGEVVGRLAAGEALAGVAGTASRLDGAAVQNPPRPLTDMNDLPPHRYDLIEVERYFRLKGERQFDYISSAGCHFRCAFCADPFVYKRKWVGINPARVGEEVEAAWRRYHFTDLSFQDETFFTYKARVVGIAEEFLRRGLRFGWTGTLRADQGYRLPDDVLALCVRSGLRRVMIGVESGSQEMLDWMTKDVTIEQIIHSAEKCVRHGIGAIFPFIVGFPGESEQSVRASVELVKRLRAMSPRFETPIFYYKPYPGSAIIREAVKHGFVLPRSLEEWAQFDFVGSSGPWVSRETFQMIERFKFYNRFAGGPETALRWPLQKIARWRCRRDFYEMPVEKFLVERLKPLPRLS